MNRYFLLYIIFILSIIINISLLYDWHVKNRKYVNQAEYFEKIDNYLMSSQFYLNSYNLERLILLGLIREDYEFIDFDLNYLSNLEKNIKNFILLKLSEESFREPENVSLKVRIFNIDYHNKILELYTLQSSDDSGILINKKYKMINIYSDTAIMLAGYLYPYPYKDFQLITREDFHIDSIQVKNINDYILQNELYEMRPASIYDRSVGKERRGNFNVLILELLLLIESPYQIDSLIPVYTHAARRYPYGTYRIDSLLNLLNSYCK